MKRLLKWVLGFSMTAVALAFAFFALYLFVSQVGFWMKTALWVEIPLLHVFIDAGPDMLSKVSPEEASVLGESRGKFSDPFLLLEWQAYRWFGGFSMWLESPKSLLGLHGLVVGVLRFVPVVVACLVCAVFAGIPGMLLAASAEDEFTGRV